MIVTSSFELQTSDIASHNSTIFATTSRPSKLSKIESPDNFYSIYREKNLRKLFFQFCLLDERGRASVTIFSGGFHDLFPIFTRLLRTL